jgi:hypothetical protein
MTSEPETLMQIMYSLNYRKMLGVSVSQWCLVCPRTKFSNYNLNRNITNKKIWKNIFCGETLLKVKSQIAQGNLIVLVL